MADSDLKTPIDVGASTKPGMASDKAAALLTTMKTLLENFPASERSAVVSELVKLFQPINLPRGGGDALNIVSSYAFDRKRFSLDDLKKHIENSTKPVPVKEVYNAVGYLTRKGKLKRVGHGKYMLDGMLVESSDMFDAEPSNIEKMDANFS